MLASKQVMNLPSPPVMKPGESTLFKSSYWGQCLELIIYLCQYEEKIIVVTGISGMGKSAMVNSIAKRNIPELTLVDDADKCTLSKISSFMNVGTGKVIIFSAPELIDRVQDSNLWDEFTSKVRIVKLEPYTLKETKKYLQHIWHIKGNVGNIPIDNRQLKEIYEISGGIPGKSKQLFIDLVKGNVVLDIEKNIKSLSPFVVGLVVFFGVVFCLMAFLWPVSEEQTFSFSTEESQPTLITHVPVVEKASVFDSVYNPEQAENEERLARMEQKLVALQKQLVTERNARNEVAEQNQPTDMIAYVANKSISASSSSSKDAIIQKNVNSRFDSLSSAPASSVKKTRLFGEEYILSLPQANYALQLLASSNEDKVKEFIKNNKIENKATYYTGLRQGKPWYIIVYGNYPNKTTALADVKNLPKSIIKLGPWARQYTYIQKSIKKNK